MSLVSPICGSAHRCLGSWFLLAEVASNPCHAQTISFCRAVKGYGVTRTAAEDPESACGDAKRRCTCRHFKVRRSEQLANADPHPAPMDDDKSVFSYPLALSPMQQLLIIKILNKEAKEGHVDGTRQYFRQPTVCSSSVHTRKSDARTHQETMAQ
ncbi:uncharacterized protein B0T23DRAFT_406037 [Neurospora hispaniola]|uniref:Uncharacterized protein n=1 Tax=Neurospora hispaniola TaxID=588809 RepID=A0AAJ0I3F9_9PEZI|nr:hypothetical protein B0T23DRAFT_406037 [Neurospora hispaniola]